MKFFLFLAVLLLAIWLWRSGRRKVGKEKSAVTSSTPQEMVDCHLCGVHVPRSDATEGKLGLYCCAEHLNSQER
jgi:uncharacterized protein